MNDKHRRKESQSEEVLKRKRISATDIHDTISAEGRNELTRPVQSLAFSGLAAGICISFSLFTEGFLRLHGGGNFLLENLGYTAGFLIVIMSRFQLFTENTLSAILPTLERFCPRTIARTMKLWGVVLTFNLLGTLIVALLIHNFAFFSPEQIRAFLEISEHAVSADFSEVLLRAVPAGFLIAALVWMLPSANGAKFWLIFSMTYIIALGEFAHVVAGSTEAFLLMVSGAIEVSAGLTYLAGACLGNIIGGAGLFAMIAYEQVKEEI